MRRFAGADPRPRDAEKHFPARAVRGRSGSHGLFEDSRLTQRERSELLDIFLASCRWTRIYYGWRPNLHDEGDNQLVELAVAGGAEFIVTHNIRHLKHMELKFEGLALATPAQLLAKEQP